MFDAVGLSREAGPRFRSLLDVSTQDAMQQRLRYHLLRLTTAGLTHEDVDGLGKLCHLAFHESDVTGQAAEVKSRVGVSPLAFAIADILESVGSGGGGPISLRSVMFGAILGAYASFLDMADEDRVGPAVLGAIGGAIATSTSTFILDNLNRQATVEYLRMEQ